MPDTTLTSAELDKLERLAKAATPDAWEMVVCDDLRPMVCTAGDVVCHADQNHSADALPDAMDMNNFAYIAAAQPRVFLHLLSLARSGLEAGKAEESMRERAALACEAQKQGFLSPQYASNQPLGSMLERFACDECADAIRALPLTGGDQP